MTIAEEHFSNAPIFTPGTVRYWYQDGAEFYLFQTEAAALGEDGALVAETEPCTVVTYPPKVPDGDILKAKAARSWFLGDWCPRNNVVPHMAGQ